VQGGRSAKEKQSQDEAKKINGRIIRNKYTGCK
jgi:hypothetical protein